MASALAAAAQSVIRVNQLGFYPDAPKMAIADRAASGKFTLLNATGKTVYTGQLLPAPHKSLAGRTTYIADFTTFRKTGTYRLCLGDAVTSYPFRIAANVHRGVAAGAIKAFYYQRASAALPERFAGQWHRAEGHPDNQVLIHPSAADNGRPAGTVISSARGWYDAGDYNKYIVNSGISMGTMLSLCEEHPAYVQNLKLNIPESGNTVPDILGELLWNLRWMLTMQDPAYGGVYHKLTNAAFDGMVMPDKATKPRYVVQKSTAATLDFAAVMAQASRIFKNYPKQLPGLSDSCFAAAQQAWQWAVAHPAVLYKQEEMNKQFQPAVSTGTYGDNDVQDEWIWAACELYITTGQSMYADKIHILTGEAMPVPSWGQVKLLGYYSLLRNQKQPSGKPLAGMAMLRKRLIAVADSLVQNGRVSAYQTVMGGSAKDFGWGSNSDAANQGILLLQVYQLTRQQKYLDAALSNLDYILGRNGTGYSYVTGYGSKTPMHPHHRPSVADGIAAPVPGLLVGGPNPGMQDHIQVPSTVPDEAYIDDDRAYAANEIAINWNAPLVYLANAIEALQQQWHRR